MSYEGTNKEAGRSLPGVTTCSSETVQHSLPSSKSKRSKKLAYAGGKLPASAGFCSVYSSILKTETICSTETSDSLRIHYVTTRKTVITSGTVFRVVTLLYSVRTGSTCHNSGGYSRASHRCGPASIPAHCKRDLCWTKYHRGSFCPST
jgi:hypothetical protein